MTKSNNNNKPQLVNGEAGALQVLDNGPRQAELQEWSKRMELFRETISDYLSIDNFPDDMAVEITLGWTFAPMLKARITKK